MEIFNKQIFGSDADWFLEQPTMAQVEWIKKHTNQQNDDIIDEFLSNITKGTDKNCLDCGQNGNKRITVSEEVITSTKSELPTKQSKKYSTKRPKNSETGKD